MLSLRSPCGLKCCLVVFFSVLNSCTRFNVGKHLNKCNMLEKLRQRNSRSFEGVERNLLEIKGTVLRTLMDWSNASGTMSFASVLDLLDFCIA
jgi:hypothetical protein